MKNTFWAFFILLIGFLALILTLRIIPAPENATGTVHPKFDTMLHGGTSVAADPTVKWLAYLFGLFVISVFAFVLFLGATKKDANLNTKIRRVFTFGFLAYTFVYTLMVFAYWKNYPSPSDDFILGFPKPTAWMMYGMWFTPLIFTFVYIFKFKDWILTPEEEARFHEIVKARSKRNTKSNK
ncbi:MAG: hypothetical protein AAF573_03565 [Bacteroidota bacterium]